MTTIEVGLSLTLSQDFAAASLPLFGDGTVDVLEWSLDRGFGPTPIPDWARGLIDAFAAQGRLLGHGVSGGLLSGGWSPRQRTWLTKVAEACRAHPFRHVSEHFGFMTAGEFRFGPPLPVPMTEDTLALGRGRLAALRKATGRPVGLENLAFAFSARDALDHGTFLERLVAPVDGFVVLDLHNLWCQIHNFELDADGMLASYPLERVREIHVSGGSFSAAPSGRAIRRDTHDHAVPEPVFELLTLALPRCPALESVILERVDDTMHEPASAAQFRADFHRIREVIHG